MKSTTQNAKITAITEKTLIIGIDVGNETHFARAFDWRGYEFSRKLLEFTKHGGRVRDVPNLDHGAEGKAQQGQGNAGKVPILGVCLGHQVICEVYGGVVTYAAHLMHGKQSDAQIDRTCSLFSGLPETIPVARYHSLAADPETIPAELHVTAVTKEHEIMAVQHSRYSVYGVQFHPESILTPHGEKILGNFLQVTGGRLPA